LSNRCAARSGCAGSHDRAADRVGFLRQYLLQPKPVPRIASPQYGFIDAVAFSDEALPAAAYGDQALNAATDFSSNFRPRPGLSGRTSIPFSTAGVSSYRQSIQGMYSTVRPFGQAAIR
jgi:hypothetical protein